MGNLFESLEDYFENTPKEILDNDWKEIEYLNEIDPNILEYEKQADCKFNKDRKQDN